MAVPNALIDSIHASPYRGVILTAGGGAGVFSVLMRRGGASATILDGGIPHGMRAVPRWLGLDVTKPDRWPPAVSSEVARGLAMAAYLHAIRLDDVNRPPLLFGIGCTVSLAKAETERVGREHKCHIAVQTMSSTWEVSFSFVPGGTREQEEEIIESAIINLIAETCGVDDRGAATGIPDPIGEVSRRREDAETCGHDELPLLIAGEVPYILYRLEPGTRPCRYTGGFGSDNQILLSTSLNPPHAGHRRMRDIARIMTGRECHLEMPIRNAAKPPLDYIEIARRLDNVARDEAEGLLILSNLGTFLDKSRVFKNARFAIGYDTAVRIPDPRYYGGGIAERDLMYQQLDSNGSQFIVFGRADADGVFQNIVCSDPKSFPDEPTFQFFRNHCAVVPEYRFREDVSSTELRRERSAE